MEPARHLVIFARMPRLGAGKRRLAADIGQLAALSFQRTALLGLINRLGRDDRWRSYLAITPDWAGLRATAHRRFRQSRGDLGARMKATLRRLPPGPAVIIGSDLPDLRPQHIEQAFRKLGSADAVFGPAQDGGYWLIGMKRSASHPDLFKAVRWSSVHTLQDTLDNLPNRKVAFLDMREDIDDGAALSRFKSRKGRK